MNLKHRTQSFFLISHFNTDKVSFMAHANSWPHWKQEEHQPIITPLLPQCRTFPLLFHAIVWHTMWNVVMTDALIQGRGQSHVLPTNELWFFPGPDVRDFSRPSSAWSSSDSAVARICHLHDLRPYGNSSCTRVAIFPFNCCFTLFIIIITIIIVIIIRRSSSTSSSFSIIWTIHQECINITQRRGKVHAGSKKTQWGHKVKLWPISLAQLRFRPELVCT